MGVVMGLADAQLQSFQRTRSAQQRLAGSSQPSSIAPIAVVGDCIAALSGNI